ncbi:hypothetical protein F5884DRAFT_188517 [Xylogone sp. PMI_703]|nr:hypothetical protein F5884DRAFT_188517 [Xylogone sp. PMI_703]
MESLLPPTPGRGRSRYSKALPVPPPAPKLPGLASTLQTPYSASLETTPRYSPLPPLPSDAPPPKRNIPRRPIGGGVKPTLSVDTMPSRESTSSSVYSDTPGLPGSASISSDKARENDPGSSLTSPVSEDDILSLYTSVEQTSPSNILSSPTSGLQKSPPRPEIWRRRSVKSDKNITVSDLKIEKSNGSTASPPQPPAERELPPAPFQLPRSKASTALPGRKPVPLRPAPPQPTTMGGSLAKLRKKLSSNALADTFSSKSSPQSLATEQNVPTDQQSFTLPLHRSPTPEAEKTDLKSEQASIPKVLSPAPPHTPPEDATPTATAAPTAQPAPIVPQKSRARKPLGEATMFSKVKSMSDLSISSSNSGTATSSASTIRPMIPSSTTPPLPQQTSPAPTSPLPPIPPASISTSNLPLQLRAPSNPSTPAATSPSTPAQGQTQAQAQFPAQQQQPAPKIVFPTIPAKDKAPEGTFFAPPPLNVVHFSCYHGHKVMRPSQNKMYPLLCMTCRKADPANHSRCAWCCLRCCNSCMQTLSSIPGRDLKTCLDRVVGEEEAERIRSAAYAAVGPSTPTSSIS